MIVISLAPEHESRVELCHDTGWETAGVRSQYVGGTPSGLTGPDTASSYPRGEIGSDEGKREKGSGQGKRGEKGGKKGSVTDDGLEVKRLIISRW
jgi:hypothetical protein